MTARLHPSLLLFLALAAAILGVEYAVVHGSAFAARPDLFSLAVAFDIHIFIPILYYLLAVRRGGLPLVSIMPVLLASGVAAGLILPAEHARAADLLGLAVVPLELGIIAYVIRNVIRLRRSMLAMGIEDTVDRLRYVMRGLVGNSRLSEVMVAEIAVWYYALFSWRAVAPAGARRFSYHRRSAYGSMVAAMAMATVVEGAGVHALAASWSPAVAWINTAMSAYMLVLLVADFRAACLRPLSVAGGLLRLRIGLRWSADIPVAEIASIGTPSREAAARRKAKGMLNGTLGGRPTLLITLRAPTVVTGPFGIRRSVTEILLGADDPVGLRGALEREMAARGPIGPPVVNDRGED